VNPEDFKEILKRQYRKQSCL